MELYEIVKTRIWSSQTFIFRNLWDCHDAYMVMTDLFLGILWVYRDTYMVVINNFLELYEFVKTHIWSSQTFIFRDIWDCHDAYMVMTSPFFGILRIYHDTYMVEINKFWNVWVRMTRKWWVCRVTKKVVNKVRKIWFWHDS